MRKLYLDDVRPCPPGYEVVRSYEEFVTWIEVNGVPDFISFDHDLGYDKKTLTDGKSGYDCAKYLVEQGLGLPQAWVVHSMNPVGRANITELLLCYTRHLRVGIHGNQAEERS